MFDTKYAAAASNSRGASTYDDVNLPTDAFLFQKLLQAQIICGAQVAHGKIDIVGSDVSKRFLDGVQDFSPCCTEITSESIFQLLLCNIFRNLKPDPVEIADGNHSARADSPCFIKIDRQGGRRTAHSTSGETGKSLPIHRSKNDEGVPCSDIKHRR